MFTVVLEACFSKSGEERMCVSKSYKVISRESATRRLISSSYLSSILDGYLSRRRFFIFLSSLATVELVLLAVISIILRFCKLLILAMIEGSFLKNLDIFFD